MAIRAARSTEAPDHPEGYSLLIGPGGVAIHYRQEGGLRAAVAVAVREVVDRRAAHEERLQDAVLDERRRLRRLALVVEAVVAVQEPVAELALRRVVDPDDGGSLVRLGFAPAIEPGLRHLWRVEAAGQ